MRKFHTLTVASVEHETRDSVRIGLFVPSELREQFAFLPGQHLPVQIVHGGRNLRRTYSICSKMGEWPLEIGIRVQPGGQFSEFAGNKLAVGDQIDVMPPFGQFHLSVDNTLARDFVGFAAGSGITPILSIIKSVLEHEPGSRFVLFYGNRKQSTTMFIEDLYSLKNTYLERLQLHFVFSQEEQEFSIAAGRLDADKVRELYARFCQGLSPAQAFVCGPDLMIETVSETLVDLGLDTSQVHAERFGVPRKGVKPVTAGRTKSTAFATVTVIMDGHKKSFDMQSDDDNIVDAAASHGIELPYSCKGGVCATCRCHLRDGEVTMSANYGLEPWELEKGFVLACQSRPVSKNLILDYDKI